MSGLSESLSSWFSSSGSGQYPLEPYHCQEFTQNHTDGTQSRLLTALNWIIMSVFSVIVFMLLIIISNRLSVTAVSGSHSTGCKLKSVVVMCDEPPEDVFKFTSAPATVQKHKVKKEMRTEDFQSIFCYNKYFFLEDCSHT